MIGIAEKKFPDGNTGDVLSTDGTIPYFSSAINISGDVAGVEYLQYDINPDTPVSEDEGLTWWNTDENTLNISTGFGIGERPISQSCNVRKLTPIASANNF